MSHGSKMKCPFCAESIRSDAKKCRYCGEWLVKEKEEEVSKPIVSNNLSVRTLFWLWIATLVIFYGTALYMQFHEGKTSPIYTFAILGDVLIGFIVFVILCTELIRSLLKKQKLIHKIKYLIATTIIFALFVFGLTKLPNANAQTLSPNQVINGINVKRETNGRARLSTNDQLSSIAKAVANDMCQKNYYSIPSPEGKDLSTFFKETSYKEASASATWIEGFRNENELANSLFNNDKTKPTLMSEMFTEIGVGIVSCNLPVLNKTTDVIVQVYAKPQPENLSKIKAPKVTQVVSPSKAVTQSDQPVHCQIDPKCGGGTTPLKKSECDNSACCLIDGLYKFTKDSGQCQDTLIKCNISPNCGGGYKEMRRMDCNNMTCCQINGTWELRSKGQCNTEQKASSYKECSDMCYSVWNLDKCNTWTDTVRLNCQTDYLQYRSSCLASCN